MLQPTAALTPGENQNSSGDRAQNTSVLPCLWVPEELQEFIPHLSKDFYVTTPGAKLTHAEHHIIALKDERSIRQILRKLQATPGTDIRIFPAQLLLSESSTGLMMKAQWGERWLEITKNGALEFPEAQAIARDALQFLHAIEISQNQEDIKKARNQWNIEKEELRQRCGLSEFNWNKYIADLEAEIHAAVDGKPGQISRADRLTLEIQACLKETKPAERTLKIKDIAIRFGVAVREIYALMRELSHSSKMPECECLSFDELLERESEEIEYLIPGLLPRRETILCVGMPKAGKTLLAIDAAFAVATGESYFLGEQVRQGKVLLVSVDESAQSTRAKLLKRGFRKGDELHVMTKWDVSQMDALEQKLEDDRPELVVIDSLKRITMGREISENSAEFADMIYQLKELTGKYGAACILIHHSNKDPDALGVGRIRGNTSIAGAVWGTWIVDRIPVPDPNNPKRLIIDPSDPKRTLSIIPRDTQGQNLKIELNPDNLSFSPSDEEDEAQEERKSQKQQILELLTKYAPKGLTGREILESLDLPRSAYNTLSRMAEQRLITERQSSGDHRVMVYCLSTPPLPSHSYKVMTNLAESTVVKPKTNSHQIVINSEKNSHHLIDEKMTDDELIPEPTSVSPISHQKDCAQGGGGDAEEAQTQAQLASDVVPTETPAGNNAESVKAARRARAKSVGDGWLVIESSAPTAPDIDSGGRENWTPGTKFRVTGRHETYKEYFGKTLTVKFNDQARSEIEAEETNHRFKYWCVELEELLEVGDMVFWSECPAHCESLAPFQITEIDGEYAKLDLFEKPARLADLSRA